MILRLSIQPLQELAISHWIADKCVEYAPGRNADWESCKMTVNTLTAAHAFVTENQSIRKHRGIPVYLAMMADYDVPMASAQDYKVIISESKEYPITFQLYDYKGGNRSLGEILKNQNTPKFWCVNEFSFRFKLQADLDEYIAKMKSSGLHFSHTGVANQNWTVKRKRRSRRQS